MNTDREIRILRERNKKISDELKYVKASYDDKEVEVIPAEGLTTPYNVLVEKASQILTFNNTLLIPP